MAKEKIDVLKNYFPIVKVPFNYEMVKNYNFMFLLDLCTSVFKWNFENLSDKENVILSTEIEKILITDELVENWTYPQIQPKLLEEAKKRGYLKDMEH